MMPVTPPLPTRPRRSGTPSAYGWSADGKSPAEIKADLRQTRYRVEADLRALRARLNPKRLFRRIAIGSAVTAVAALLLRRLARR